MLSDQKRFAILGGTEGNNTFIFTDIVELMFIDVNNIKMEIEKVGILTDYLDISKYEAVAKSSQRRNILYLSYLEMI